MNRVVKFSEYGEAHVLNIEQLDSTELAVDKGQVRVKVQAVALNRSDSLFRQGQYIFDATFPSRICVEGVGSIDAMAEDVEGFSIGQRVGLLAPADISSSGYAADFAIVDKNLLLPIPDNMDVRHAATTWVPFLTVYHLFVEQHKAKEGSWIVLPAASSSVALAANNVARYLGAQTIALTRTSRKKEELLAVGYSEVIVSEDEDVTARIKEITGGGADFIFDPVGGPQLKELVAAVNPGADINIYGVLSSENTVLPIFEMMQSGARLSSYSVYELLQDPVRLKQAINFYLPLFESGKLLPVVDTTEFTLDSIVDAFKHLESNTQLGKVVLTV